jgi:hypothetical protein
VATYRSKDECNTNENNCHYCMLIDHMTWAFVETNTPLAAILHAVGRLTGPTMFFFIAEGYYHTHDLKKYIERLALFALISHVPYNLFINQGNALTLFPTSVIFTLLCGLLALHAITRFKTCSQIFVYCCTLPLTIGADWEFSAFIWHPVLVSLVISKKTRSQLFTFEWTLYFNKFS